MYRNRIEKVESHTGASACLFGRQVRLCLTHTRRYFCTLNLNLFYGKTINFITFSASPTLSLQK